MYSKEVNLILTPIHVNNENSLEVLRRMTKAIDQYSKEPFLHILIDDNSKMNVLEEFSFMWRRGIKMVTDYKGRQHKNQLGQGLQLGMDFARQAFSNEEENAFIKRVFIIESDVIVKENWDTLMIRESEELEKEVGQSGWFTLDCLSVDEGGEVTYPTQGNRNNHFNKIKFAEFQCTLINPAILFPKFSDFPSHFDILWSRKLSELNNAGEKFYSTSKVEVLHLPHTSRKEYM